MYNLYEKVATQDGVTFIYDNHNSTFACDMDIAPGVKTVEISMNLDMPYSYKCFSDVEKLIIKENVSTINIPNELFPNVRQVKSQSKHFLSGSCLIGSYFIKKRLYILKNVFHCDKDEAIDLKRVSAIDNYAFRGCKCTNLINTEYIKTWNDVYENAFTGSAFMEQPFVNGVKMAGNIVLAVDDTADEVIIPDDNKNVVFARDVRLSNVKKMVIHKEDSLYNLSYETGLPINLVLKINKPVLNVKVLVDLIKEDGRPDDWREFPRKHMEHHSSYVKHLSVLSPYYKEIDGIVYTSDMKTAVIMCNLDIEQIIIPEGVTHISYQAFSQSQLKTIKLPDSLTEIGEKAFSCCFALKTVRLNEGLKKIGRNAFNRCYNLKEITLPETLESIGQYGLSWIQKVNVQGKMLPWGIMLGVTTRGYPGLMPSIVEINHNGNMIFLPKCVVSDTSMRNLNSLANAAAPIDETWKYATDDEAEKELAVKDCIYRKENGEEFPKSQEYINQNMSQILAWLVDTGKTEAILSLIRTKTLSTEDIEYLLRLTENVNMRAYILDTAQKEGLYEDSLNI